MGGQNRRGTSDTAVRYAAALTNDSRSSILEPDSDKAERRPRRDRANEKPGIILYYLRTAVVALNSAERYYTAFALVLASAVMCISILERY